MVSHVKSQRLSGLPEKLRSDLVAARHARSWSQRELASRVGLPQAHISGIEIGKITPRFNTLLDLVRVLNYDLLLVPRSLVPAVQSLVRDQRQPGMAQSEEGEHPLYADESAGARHDP